MIPLHEIPSREWFLEAVDLLGRLYRFVDLAGIDEIVRGGSRATNTCHLTFDDGDSSFYDLALPVLRARQIPATLFVSPHVIKSGEPYWFQTLSALRARVPEEAIKDEIAERTGYPREAIEPLSVVPLFLSMTRDTMAAVLGGIAAKVEGEVVPARNLTAAQLREVAGSGLVSVGAHTMTHPVLANEKPGRAAWEVEESVAALSALLDRKVTAFAYPNGTELDFGPREQDALERAGVTLAFTMIPGFVSGECHPLAVPRGGCPNVEGESAILTAARLVCLPWWDRFREATGRRSSERLERLAIRAFPPSAVASS